MSTNPPTRRRWLRFGTGTMLVLVTVFGVWLAGQVNKVKQRRATLRFIQEKGGLVSMPRHWNSPPPMNVPIAVMPEISIPFWRRWMGDEPVFAVLWPADVAKSDMEQVAAAIPEAEQIIRTP